MGNRIKYRPFKAKPFKAMRSFLKGDIKRATIQYMGVEGTQANTELTAKQNRLLGKALRQMGLSREEMAMVSTGANGTPREVIETVLARANKLQDGGGNNG